MFQIATTSQVSPACQVCWILRSLPCVISSMCSLATSQGSVERLCQSLYGSHFQSSLLYLFILYIFTPILKWVCNLGLAKLGFSHTQHLPTLNWTCHLWIQDFWFLPTIRPEVDDKFLFSLTKLMGERIALGKFLIFLATIVAIFQE